MNRLVDTGKKYGMEIDCDKSKAMRVYRRNESLRIKVGNGERRGADYFKCLTRDGYCTRRIKMRKKNVREKYHS